MKLENISFAEFLSLEDKTEYNFAINYSYEFNEPIDEFNIGDFQELSFGLIKDLQDDFFNGMMDFTKMLEYITDVFKIKDIGNERIDKVFRLIAYIRTSIRNIINVELKSLSYESNNIEHDAGIDEFSLLGVYMQFHELTGGDVTKYEAVRAMPYHICFTELYTRKLKYEYQKRIERLNRNTK